MRTMVGATGCITEGGDVAESFASPFDAVLWERADSDQPIVLADARRSAIARNHGKDVQVSFDTVFTSGAHPFETLAPQGMSAWRRRERADGVELLQLEDADGRWVLAAFATAFPGVFHLVSGLPTTHPRSQKVDRWVARAHDVSRCYLDHDDFMAIGDRLSEWGDVEVVKLAARVVKDGSSINRGFPAQGDGLRPSHRDGLAEAENLGAAVRTLTLHVSETMHVHLRRLAGATLYSGIINVFEEQVLARLEQATADRRDLLSGRARQSLDARIRPLSVALPEPLLVTREDTGAVLDAIHKMSNVSMAVFHRNPYLHVVVTDEVDGSNFDVMITRPDAIDIYPGFRASTAALARVTQQFGQRFGALDLAIRTEASDAPSAYDLIQG